MSLVVRVGAVEFHGQEAMNGYGFYIESGGFSGWGDGTEPRLAEIARPQAHGYFDLPAFQGSRVVNISGLAVAPTASALNHMQSQITGLLADGSSSQVFVAENGLETWANARLGARSKFSPVIGGGVYADFAVTLWCPNPRKYGETRTFGPGTSVLAHHRGNFAASPVITVEGDMPSGYSIDGPDGKFFTVSAAVESDHPHVIDMATGHLYVDDEIVYGSITSADVWTIPGGSEVVHNLLPDSGSGTVTVTVKDTYI